MTEVPEREDPAVPSHGSLFDDPLAPATPPEPAPDQSVSPEPSPDEPVSPEPAAHEPASPEPSPDEQASPEAPAPVASVAEPATSAPAWVPSTDEPVAVRPGPAVDTGRLFRSAGAEGPAAEAAIPAITDEQPPPAGAAAAAVAVGAAAGAGAAAAGGAGAAVSGGAAAAAGGEGNAAAPPLVEPGQPAAVPGAAAVPVRPLDPALTDPALADEAAAASAAAGTDTAGVEAPAYRGGNGLTWTGVTVVEIGVTVLLGFADVLVTKNIGIITGVALVLVSIYCALVVRPADLWAAVVTPPIAYLAALLTAGLLTYTGGGFVARTGIGVFTDLALNAPWIIAATLVSLVIVLVRRARARRAGVLPAR